MKDLVHRLEKKGWQRQEIIDAVKIIKKAKEKKTHHFLQKRMYWVLLLFLVVINFAVSISLVPVLMALHGFGLYFIIFVFGLFFGLMFELLARTIEHLEKKHHIWLSVLIPAIGVLSGLSIANFSNVMDYNLGIKNFNSPFYVALVYAASFALPFIFYKFVMKKEYYSG